MKWPGHDHKAAHFIYYILQIVHSKSIKWLLNWNTFQVLRKQSAHSFSQSCRSFYCFFS